MRAFYAPDHGPIRRFMIPDTLGILNPDNTYAFCCEMIRRYPDVRFDFHAHNDYDLAVANVMAAVKAGSTRHSYDHQRSRRAGGQCAAVERDCRTERPNQDAERGGRTADQPCQPRGRDLHRSDIPANKPVVGENVFTQCAGIHADGDNKDNLYYNDLLPERFGRVREYALGKMSGKANIRKNLDALGIDLDEESMRKVTERIIELGDKKQTVTSDDLPYIIADILRQDVQETEYISSITTFRSVRDSIRWRRLKSASTMPITKRQLRGDGQYDAFMKALRKIYKGQLGRDFPMLTNYSVTIPPGGRTDAFVQTFISWEYRGQSFKTRGLDADQTEAAIKATLKMLNKIENMQ